MKTVKKTILLVEDEPSLINLYREILKNDYHVLTADNFETAKASIYENPADLILLDLLIPVKKNSNVDYTIRQGFELLKVIRKETKFRKIPVIVLTNLDSALDRKTAKDLKATDFVIKANILPSELREKVKKIINVSAI